MIHTAGEKQYLKGLHQDYHQVRKYTYSPPIGKLALSKLDKFMQGHELLQLAKIEAVHRYLFDHCFHEYTGKLLDTPEAKYIFDLYQTLHCEVPDWRYRLKKKLERYHGWEKTNALHKDSKPNMSININIHI